MHFTLLPQPFRVVARIRGYLFRDSLVLLAATTKDRVDIAPDIPTAAELGFPDLTVSAWLGFIARAETPKAIVQQLNQEIVKAVANPVVQKRIIETGNVPSTGSPEAFDAVIKADMDRWGRIARALKIELE